MADNYIAELDFGKPRIDDQAFVAPTAVVVGAVTMGAALQHLVRRGGPGRRGSDRDR